MLIAGQSSHSYKQYSRKQRKLVSEGMFTNGMQFTDNPLPLGTSRLMVNMIQKDYGKRIRPRGGWRSLAEPVSLGNIPKGSMIHHTGTIFIEDTVDKSVFLRRYALILPLPDVRGYASTDKSKVLIEEPLDVTDPKFNIEPGKLKVSSWKSGATHRTIKYDTREAVTRMHDMVIEAPSPEGIAASINGNTYLLTPSGLGRLHVYYNSNTKVYTHEVKMVEPMEVTPMQAINYGYNMLLTNPYSFSNKTGATFSPQGILPYDTKTGKLKMQAKVGEPVRFKLVYSFKEDEEYKVQWEVQDIYRRDGIITIVDKKDSPVYKDGEDIYLDYTSPLKQFSVIATIYEAEDLTNPLRTVILASYHLADDTNHTRMEEKNYNLMTAKGVAVWKNQMVYYRVAEAEMSIFISDVNDPTYVPFPNQTVTFNEKVVKAFPYMDSLMVITEHTMFQVDFHQEDGFTYKPVQANLQLRDDDADSMYGVRNMLCFKARNYYYMVVPNVKSDQGDLQIAPISNDVTILLDHFEASIRKILSEVYTLKHLFKAPDEAILINLYDYKSYPDNNRLRHVYKVKFSIHEYEYFVDFHLIYDTVFRTWTVEAMESTKRPLHVFQSISTGYAQFLGLYTIDNTTYAQWVGINENDPADNFNLDEGKDRTVQNFQMFDTGKRDLEGTKKKRLRHVILEFNNLSQQDVEFNHIVYIDDDPRSDLFKYNVIHETDPNAPNYGQIFVEREYLDPTLVAGTTRLGTWSLGNSQFPEQTILKVHLDISGKGYYPRLRVITQTSKLYELNMVSWAYREMNAR